jgi:hypothetical protein
VKHDETSLVLVWNGAGFHSPRIDAGHLSCQYKMSKYHNRKTEVDGFVFDSRREANRYVELKLLERAGEIYHLELQPKFEMVVNGMKICDYYADFRYQEGEKTIVEDAKGVRTDVFRIKKKLLKAIYGIDVVEV